MHLGIEGDLPKEHGIAERSEEFSRQDAFLLLQWLDGLRRAAGLQTVPVGHQLFLVELRPCFDEPALASRQLPGDQIDRVDAEDGHVVLMVRVEVRTMIRAADAALTPRPRINLVLYHGVLAPHARWRGRAHVTDRHHR